MTIVRTAPAALLLILWGCVGLRSYSEDAPAGYSIAGTWTLNAALSTDTGKALAALRADHGRPRRAASESDPDLPPPIDTRATGEQGPPGFGGGAGMARDRYRPPLDVQQEVLKGGDWLQIRQDPDEVEIRNEITGHSYTPGERSVVSVPSGVADQSSGWKGRSYAVEIRPQVGPRVMETYALSADGRRLIVNIDIGSEGGNRALKVTRVYDRSTGPSQPLPVEN